MSAWMEAPWWLQQVYSKWDDYAIKQSHDLYTHLFPHYRTVNYDTSFDIIILIGYISSHAALKTKMFQQMNTLTILQSVTMVHMGTIVTPTVTAAFKSIVTTRLDLVQKLFLVYQAGGIILIVIYVCVFITVCRGGSRGGLWGLEPPPETKEGLSTKMSRIVYFIT